MQIRIFALPGGKTQIMVDDASFEEAQELTERLLGLLKQGGLPIEIVGTVEQHKDGVSHAHIINRLEANNG